MKTEDLIAEVTSLPIEERARVADRLLRSLNPPDSDIDQKWAEVAQRRLAEHRSGLVRATPGEEVFAQVWKRLGV